MGFGFVNYNKTKAQSLNLTGEDLQRLQVILSDPANQQLFIQDPNAFIQSLQNDPQTADLFTKFLVPDFGLFQQIIPDLQQFPDLLKQYQEFLPTTPGGFLGLPPPAELQKLIEDPLSLNQLTLQVITLTPSPRENVKAAAEIPGQNSRNVNFTWRVDNEIIKSGLGEGLFEFRAKGKVGQTMQLRVSATLPDGSTLSASQTLRVADVILSFSAQSLTPHNYKGLNLPSFNSRVVVSAIPLLPFRVPASQLNYRWSINGSVVQSNSINSFAFNINAQPGLPQYVRVEIVNPTNTLQIVKTLSIPVTRPQVLLYQDKYNLLALNRKSVESGKTVKFVALPYFFSSSSENLIYRWRFLNNEVLGSGEEPNVLEAVTPKQTLARVFRSSLNLLVKNPKDDFEQARVSLPLSIK